MQKHMVFGNVTGNFLAFYAVTKTSTPGLSKSASSKTLTVRHCDHDVGMIVMVIV